MPQLNPAPWFLYLLLVWLIFIYMIPNKILPHLSLNEPAPKTSKPWTPTWNWPWQ